jgi:hypothetical protein
MFNTLDQVLSIGTVILKRANFRQGGVTPEGFIPEGIFLECSFLFTKTINYESIRTPRRAANSSFLLNLKIP